MGEIADAMINGEHLCGGCGVFLEWADGPGFPLYCSRSCAPNAKTWQISLDYRQHASHRAEKVEDIIDIERAVTVIRCPKCLRQFRTAGALANHTKDVHQ